MCVQVWDCIVYTVNRMYFKDFKWEFPKFKNLIFKFFSQRIKNKILAQLGLQKVDSRYTHRK